MFADRYHQCHSWSRRNALQESNTTRSHRMGGLQSTSWNLGLYLGCTSRPSECPDILGIRTRTQDVCSLVILLKCQKSNFCRRHRHQEDGVPGTSNPSAMNSPRTGNTPTNVSHPTDHVRSSTRSPSRALPYTLLYSRYADFLI